MDWQLSTEDKIVLIMDLCVSKLTIFQLCRFMEDARCIDLLECKHMTGVHFSETNISEFSNAVCLYDKDRNDVYAIGGVDKTTIWMLCTHKVEKHPTAFLRFCKDYLRHWQNKYNYLENYVWLGNDLHVKWLKWMGAKFDRLYTVRGQTFQHFYFEK